MLFTISLNANIRDIDIVERRARSTKKGIACFNLATEFAMTF